MPHIKVSLLASCLLALAIIPFRALAGDSFAGGYTGPKLSIEIVVGDNSYTGSLHLGNQVFPIKAQATAGQLVGTFTSGGHEFPFTASLAGDNMTLTSGSTTYQLTRNAAAPVPNPLDNPAPANPLSPNIPPPEAAPASSDAPAGYSVAVATDAGKAWVTKKPGIIAVAPAMEATLSDLTKFSGANPSSRAHFEDTKDHQSGAASFTGTFAAQPIVGLVTCKLGDDEAKICVTYCSPPRRAADWAKLNADAKAAPPWTPSVKLTRLIFPTAPGRSALPKDGRSRAARSSIRFMLPAPAIRRWAAPAYFGLPSMRPILPAWQAEDMQRRSDATWRRLGRRPPPHPPFPFMWRLFRP